MNLGGATQRTNTQFREKKDNINIIRIMMVMGDNNESPLFYQCITESIKWHFPYDTTQSFYPVAYTAF